MRSHVLLTNAAAHTPTFHYRIIELNLMPIPMPMPPPIRVYCIYATSVFGNVHVHIGSVASAVVRECIRHKAVTCCYFIRLILQRTIICNGHNNAGKLEVTLLNHIGRGYYIDFIIRTYITTTISTSIAYETIWPHMFPFEIDQITTDNVSVRRTFVM